ncbi:hypothetical protein O6H91_05G112800 [Diphasiastrum complanatum]|uniref:Uncharacterized protein n=1 Tax=Diphasiastrum complanatum TaxID=34168 RepID=A0ACC2DS73_DIPCM|nr:hypothetical protein O6H91_05G112800 [Diphasiastrum complanatum]
MCYDEELLGLYTILWDPMRAIRMDLRMQHISTVKAILMHEHRAVLPATKCHNQIELTPTFPSDMSRTSGTVDGPGEDDICNEKYSQSLIWTRSYEVVLSKAFEVKLFGMQFTVITLSDLYGSHNMERIFKIFLIITTFLFDNLKKLIW